MLLCSPEGPATAARRRRDSACVTQSRSRPPRWCKARVEPPGRERPAEGRGGTEGSCPRCPRRRRPRGHRDSKRQRGLRPGVRAPGVCGTSHARDARDADRETIGGLRAGIDGASGRAATPAAAHPRQRRTARRRRIGLGRRRRDEAAGQCVAGTFGPPSRPGSRGEHRSDDGDGPPGAGDVAHVRAGQHAGVAAGFSTAPAGPRRVERVERGGPDAWPLSRLRLEYLKRQVDGLVVPSNAATGCWVQCLQAGITLSRRPLLNARRRYRVELLGSLSICHDLLPHIRG